MPTYQISIGSRTFHIDSPSELTDAQAYQAILSHPEGIAAQNEVMKTNMAAQEGAGNAEDPWTARAMGERALAGAKGEAEGFGAGVLGLTALPIAAYGAVRHPVETARGLGILGLSAAMKAKQAYDNPSQTLSDVTNAATRFAADPENIGKATGGVMAMMATPSIVRAATESRVGQAAGAFAKTALKKTPIMGPATRAAVKSWRATAPEAAVGAEEAGPILQKPVSTGTTPKPTSPLAADETGAAPSGGWAGPERRATTGQPPSGVSERRMGELMDKFGGTRGAEPAATPPPDAGAKTVRLYRGESATGVAGPEAGRTFTDNPLDAMYYAKQGGRAGQTFYIDLPEAEAAGYRTADPTGQGVHLLPEDVAARARGNVLGSGMAQDAPPAAPAAPGATNGAGAGVGAGGEVADATDAAIRRALGKEPVSTIPPTASKNPMSATPGLTQADVQGVGLNPENRILAVRPDLREQILANRAGRRRAYVSNAELDRDASQALDRDEP